jgi:hypothetical protein
MLRPMYLNPNPNPNWPTHIDQPTSFLNGGDPHLNGGEPMTNLEKLKKQIISQRLKASQIPNHMDPDDAVAELKSYISHYTFMAEFFKTIIEMQSTYDVIKYMVEVEEYQEADMEKLFNIEV